MKRTRTGFIKNLRYLCLIGVIALGLMTIVGSNGASTTSGTGGTSIDCPTVNNCGGNVVALTVHEACGGCPSGTTVYNTYYSGGVKYYQCVCP